MVPVSDGLSLLRGGVLPHRWRLVVMSEVDSTNDEIRRRATFDPAEGLVVVASRQTAGRGRRGRSWASPEGNLYLSVRLQQERTLGETAQLSYVAAVALADTLAAVAAPHIDPRLKWPNDVLVQGGNVAGILVETDGDAVIVGVGINVATAPDTADALYPPLSLRDAGVELTCDEILRAFVPCLADMVSIWRGDGMAAISPLWKKRAIGLNRPVVARLQSGAERHGIFVDLDAQGAMLLRSANGRIERLLAGDVFFPRSTSTPRDIPRQPEGCDTGSPAAGRPAGVVPAQQ